MYQREWLKTIPEKVAFSAHRQNLSSWLALKMPKLVETGREGFDQQWN
jgi:hypothetical protein